MSLKEEIEQYLQTLFSSEYYDEEQGMSLWTNTAFKLQMSVTQCTAGAMLIADKFEGRVYGYPLDINDPSNKDIIGYMSMGHDFCIVDDYLVDYWAHFVHDEDLRPIIDLSDASQLPYLQKYYLPKHRWEVVPTWEKAIGETV